MQIIKYTQPNNLKPGDTITNHGRVHKVITKVIQLNQNEWEICHTRGKFTTEFNMFAVIVD